MKLRQQQGYFLILAVIFVMVIGLMSALIAYLFSSRAALSVAQRNGLRAFYNSESALEVGTRLLTRPDLVNRIACGSITGTSTITNATLNTGTFTITTVNSSPIFSNDTLSTAETASDTIINLASSAGFATSGRIMIDHELIDYAAISGNTLIGVTRGAAGTTATTHSSGAAVGQYQCTLDAKAGIPNLTSPNYQRELQWGVQLQDGWLVGSHTTARQLVFGRWNNTTEKIWNPSLTTLTVNVDLLDVFALSYSDAWAVGTAQSNNLTFYHWNGATWSRVLPAVSVNAAVNGVYCNSSSDCWAVGQNNSNNPIIERWNGSSWTRVLPAVSVNAALQGVNCNNTNDCWAVGLNNASNPLMERWNGTSWTRVTPTTAINVDLYSVFCNSSSNCWAVGQNNASNPVIERWNGSAWTRVLPTAAINKILYSVYCNSASDCWSVGQNNAGSLFILHWNGANWSPTSPSVSNSNDLHSVSCVNTDDCWAVGEASTLVHWDGTAWSLVSAPAGFTGVDLNSISLLGPAQEPAAKWRQIFT